MFIRPFKTATQPAFPLRRIALIAALLLGLPGISDHAPLPALAGETGSSQTGLPNLGDGADMAPAAERRLGDRVVREIYRDPDYVDDPVILEYVQGIWQSLLQAARLQGQLPAELEQSFAWEPLLVRDRSVNAFALPGGYMGVHLGLVAVVGSSDELASVLAHELSHITQRHISRSMTRQSEQAPWLMGAMILGMLAASKSPGAANASIVGGQALAVQSQLNFSRDMEREADRVGFGVLTQAGYAPQGFVSMFEKLQQSSRLNDAGGFPYLRSHPLTSERIADMQGRVASAAPQPASGDVLRHSMVAARARVLANPAVDAMQQVLEETSPTLLNSLPQAQQLGRLYAGTCAALRLREFAKAQALWARLQASSDAFPELRALVQMLGAELALAQGKPEQAQLHLQNTGESLAGSSGRARLLLQAQADTASGRADRAAQNLQTWLAGHPHDATAWQQLASADGALGRSVAAVRDTAEASGAMMDYAAALARLRAAQDMVRKSGNASDHIEASIVDTRARQFELLVREQTLER
jgi:predicted Zn-dependent protease